MSSRLIVGIDFSTQWVDAHLMAPDGNPAAPPQRFDNSLPGYQGLKQLVLATLSRGAYTGVDIAGEATGMYWLPFFLELAADPELAAHDVRSHSFNPRWIKGYKRSISELDKTDPNDAFVIADRTRVRPPDVPWEIAPQQLALRCLSRYRFHLTRALAAEKSFCCAYLFLKASAYQRLAPFSDVFGTTSRFVISQAITLDTLADLPVADLAATLAEVSGHTLPDPHANARRLKQVATESFQLPDELVLPVHQLIEATLQHITFLEAQIAAADAWLTQSLAHFPAIQKLQTIPGIGPVLSTGIGAEIGDVQRFLRGTQRDAQGRRRPKNLRDAENAVAKFAGLWWPRVESGTFAAEDRHMSKRGNAYLRYYLIQAADELRKHVPEYRAFYSRKYREATKHHHKRALVLTARKSVGLIVGMLHRDEPYRSQEAHRT